MLKTLGLIPTASLAVLIMTLVLAVFLLYRTKYHQVPRVWLRGMFMFMSMAVPIGVCLMLVGYKWGLVLMLVGLPIYLSTISTKYSDSLDNRNAGIDYRSMTISESAYVARLKWHLAASSLIVGSAVLGTWMSQVMTSFGAGEVDGRIFFSALMGVVVGCFAPMAACHIRDDIAASYAG